MKKATLLIVDDEIEIRQMLSRNFRLKGFDVELAGNGVEALAVLAEKRIDVVISDIMMPEMDGVCLLRNIRQQYPMIRVIMITGYVTLENALACMRVGAQTCVFKPFTDLGELDAEVDCALDSLRKWQEKLRVLRGMKTAEGAPTA
jgi:DNA-binding NtrC family response regulator